MRMNTIEKGINIATNLEIENYVLKIRKIIAKLIKC